MLEEADLFLRLLVSIFIFMLKEFWTIGIKVRFLEVLGNNIFTNSLIGIIIQDGSKRERSNNQTYIRKHSSNYL